MSGGLGSSLSLDDIINMDLPNVLGGPENSTSVKTPDAVMAANPLDTNPSEPVPATTNAPIEEPRTKTWALVTPPGLLGGYRNQVIRMFGLVIAAYEQKIPQLLLPSILWSTRTVTTNGTSVRPVPMEDLFDIEHWNSFAKELPKLVDHLGDDEETDCWARNVDGWREENKELTHKLKVRDPLIERILDQPRFLTPIANISLAYTTGQQAINPRRFDVSPLVQHCKNPIAYGGGGGRGILWVNYMDYGRRRPRDKKTGYVQPSSLEQVFLRALKPLPKWRRLAQQCVIDGTRSNMDTNNNDGNYHPSVFSHIIALHPRVELEMMAHGCENFMNKNLTKIFQDVERFVQNNTGLANNISGVFVALHRAGASSKEGRVYQQFRAHIDENIETMDRVIGKTTLPGKGLSITNDRHEARSLPVFECGDQLLERYYQSQSEQPVIDYGSLLPSIINFDVAVEAAVFVGMRSSSWSNSVWTTRYYLGKGHANFEYTRERGIQPIENGGLPPPHQNCDAIKDPG